MSTDISTNLESSQDLFSADVFIAETSRHVFPVLPVFIFFTLPLNMFVSGTISDRGCQMVQLRFSPNQSMFDTTKLAMPS